jgi:hypothetical protein
MHPCREGMHHTGHSTVGGFRYHGEMGMPQAGGRADVPRRDGLLCPPHTPLRILTTAAGGRVAECLGCGLRGPERATPEAARDAIWGVPNR